MAARSEWAALSTISADSARMLPTTGTVPETAVCAALTAARSALPVSTPLTDR